MLVDVLLTLLVDARQLPHTVRALWVAHVGRKAKRENAAAYLREVYSFGPMRMTPARRELIERAKERAQQLSESP